MSVREKFTKTIAVSIVVAIMVAASLFLIHYLRPGRAVQEFKKECLRQQQDQTRQAIEIKDYPLDPCKDIIKR